MRTDSFTPCSANAVPDAAVRAHAHSTVRCLLMLLCVWASLAVWPKAWAEAVVVEVAPLVLDRGEEGVYLSTQLGFELPSSVEDALTKGMAIHFVTEATTLRFRWYWYDKRVAQATRYVRLSYQPLSRRWRLQASTVPMTHSGQGVVLGQAYDSLREALAGVQRISRWRIAGPTDLEPDARHSVEFQFRLDVSQLPRPFQLGVVGQSDWNIQAERTIRLDPIRAEPPKGDPARVDLPRAEGGAR